MASTSKVTKLPVRKRVPLRRHLVMAAGVAALATLILSPNFTPSAQALEDAEQAPTTRRVAPAGGRSELGNVYRLPVAEVPPPPEAVLARAELTVAAVSPQVAAGSIAEAPAQVSRCPEVRAIVTGGDSPFTILAAGGESVLIREGEAKKIGGQWFRVRKITTAAVTIRTGDDHILPCSLQR